MADEVRVDPSVLRVGARACEDLHADVSRDEAGIEGATTDAARGLSCWYTRRALEDLLWWWRDDLSKLGKYLDTFGGALEACARDYAHTDKASADHFDIRGR